MIEKLGAEHGIKLTGIMIHDKSSPYGQPAAEKAGAYHAKRQYIQRIQAMMYQEIVDRFLHKKRRYDIKSLHKDGKYQNDSKALFIL